MKITIEDTEFEIDIERAKALGLCKEVHKPLTEVVSGGIYSVGNRSHSNVLVIQTNYKYGGERFYQIYGDVYAREVGTLAPFSNYPNPVNQKTMLDYLNYNGFKLMKTIGDEVVNLVLK